MAGFLPLRHPRPGKTTRPTVEGEHWLSFLGQYEHSLDAKNRLTIPAKFRGPLSDGVVLAKQLDPCISIWPATSWERFTERSLTSRDPFDEDVRTLQRFFHAGSFDSQLDAAGRIMLPQPLLEHAALKKDVVLIGNQDTIEVWDRDHWRAEEGRINEAAVTVARRLSRGGAGDTTS
jgi:MraZ protein